MKLADKIRILRKARGVSQEELGFSLASKDNGVSRQSISDWENGKSEPKLDNIRALAVFLNVSFNSLLDEKLDLNDPDVLNKILTNGYVEKDKQRRYLLFWIIFTSIVFIIALALIIPFAIEAVKCFQEAAEFGEGTIFGKTAMNRALIMCIPALIGILLVLIAIPLLGLKIFAESKKVKAK